LAARYEDDGLKHPTTLTPIDLKLKAAAPEPSDRTRGCRTWLPASSTFKAGKNGELNASAAFELAALRDPTNADIQNYIGYAYRRLRQLGPAIGHYQQALILNPRHRSAHEHLGEAYLVLDGSAKAEQLLAALENLCLILRLRMPPH
jgi:Flp pilus assembly protein TadD